MCMAMIGIAASPSTAVAQQKTAKTCQEEWRANKADNQAKGITEKAYVVPTDQYREFPAAGGLMALKARPCDRVQF